ncbi:Protein-L-isoaspartate O-methyltransferase [Thioalkalivibrio nitratireducens DSM 14787]|uniref:Protein-L-isoaspartate O-methyltransferase n=1 Tax=Thioalkalivibrio nitratireducens (strain DSM 14787 / UNIQEM 213 / ALEN2) TaxID=1255043 RepID=L0E094_THIND|nr:protein-L-isoaspartate O-methyltransferase [Thioalkalivibrio nitratireducens]AGA35259.1 Protein-L-isoaspartate O-methyltransferase [Thioalkalivibrio nitratireducens DSM 14787]
MDFTLARVNMVEQQVRPWDVLDMRVLDVMESLPRETFVPAGREGLAYADTEIPLGHGESMLAPRVVGRLLQALAPGDSETALEIGTGSGFVTACLARLAAQVDSVERVDEFRLAARARLEALGIGNASLRTATASPGWTPPRNRYDVISVNGAMTDYDPFLQSSLSLGGRLFVVVGRPPVMHARLVIRVAEDSYRTETLFETRLKPLLGFEPRPEFVF